MLSAHGSSPAVVAGAADRAAVVIDAVCPLVTKVHHEVKRMADKGFDILYIGHEGHDEAMGTVAEAPDSITLIEPERGLGEFAARDPEKVALLAQTTLGTVRMARGDAVRPKSGTRICGRLGRATSATQPPTGNRRFRHS